MYILTLLSDQWSWQLLRAIRQCVEKDLEVIMQRYGCDGGATRGRPKRDAAKKRPNVQEKKDEEIDKIEQFLSKFVEDGVYERCNDGDVGPICKKV